MNPYAVTTVDPDQPPKRKRFVLVPLFILAAELTACIWYCRSGIFNYFMQNW